MSQAAIDSDVEDADESGEDSLTDGDYEQEASSSSSEDPLLSDAEPDADRDVPPDAETDISASSE